MAAASAAVRPRAFWGWAGAVLSAVPAPGISVEELKIALDEAVTNALDRLNDGELNRVKNRMLAGLVYLKDNPFDAAYIVGSLYAVGMSKDDIENYADNIRKVDVPAVKKAAEKLLTASAAAEGTAEPLPRGEKDE